jgi:hypothetical protein
VHPSTGRGKRRGKEWTKKKDGEPRFGIFFVARGKEITTRDGGCGGKTCVLT